MDTAALLKFIEDWARQFSTRLDELVDGLDKRVQVMQRELWRRIVDVLGDMFEYDNGKLKRTPANIRALKKLERLFDGFTGSVIESELELFANELLEVSGLTVGYFESTAPNSKAEYARKALELVRSIIGIDENGVLAAGGYLDSLGEIQSVRNELRDYVVRSIVVKKSLSEFQKGFKLLIEGNDGIDGALQKYWRQYTYDTYNQVHEVANQSMADSLGMKYFIYQGSIIATTREFCRKKAGKVFSTIEALLWKDDPDLIDKKTKALYTFLERGRYNCRHFLNYISEALAFELRPELKK